ncbi:MAG: response regulator [Planctomycetes bacterium]|nr:response regulator [Planctomycetota bacterium]
MTARPRPVVLVVDDEEDSRVILGRIAEKQGFDVVTACDGPEALTLERRHRPDLILLDIQMPGMSGLEVLSEVRAVDPHVPIVIVSGTEDESVGERALGLGAVNFIRKPFDVSEIRFVLDHIRAAVQEEEDQALALAHLRERRTVLEIGNELSHVAPVVAYLGRELRAHYPGYDVPVTETKLALYEALANAVEHGNLEIDYDEKTRAMTEEGGIRGLIDRRRADPRLRDRRVRIEAEYDPESVTWRIRDEGRGFSPHHEERDHRLGDTSALHGRGIRLMRHYMDDVSWNATGTEIRLTLSLRRRVQA